MDGPMCGYCTIQMDPTPADWECKECGLLCSDCQDTIHSVVKTTHEVTMIQSRRGKTAISLNWRPKPKHLHAARKKRLNSNAERDRRNFLHVGMRTLRITVYDVRSGKGQHSRTKALVSGSQSLVEDFKAGRMRYDGPLTRDRHPVNWMAPGMYIHGDTEGTANCGNFVEASPRKKKLQEALANFPAIPVGLSVPTSGETFTPTVPMSAFLQNRIQFVKGNQSIDMITDRGMTEMYSDEDYEAGAQAGADWSDDLVGNISYTELATPKSIHSPGSSKRRRGRPLKSDTTAPSYGRRIDGETPTTLAAKRRGGGRAAPRGAKGRGDVDDQGMSVVAKPALHRMVLMPTMRDGKMKWIWQEPAGGSGAHDPLDDDDLMGSDDEDDVIASTSLDAKV